MAQLHCNKIENFTFSLKYRQRKVDLNTSKESLVFVTMRHRKYSYCIRKFRIYKIIRIGGEMLLSYIVLWRKAQKIWYFCETETYKNWQKYDLFCPFHKFFFSCGDVQILYLYIYLLNDNDLRLFDNFYLYKL